MKRKNPQRLPKDLQMPCYACEVRPATHVCRYQVGELAVQVCLCGECMKMDTHRLLKNTIGIQDHTGPLPQDPILESTDGPKAGGIRIIES